MADPPDDLVDDPLTNEVTELLQQLIRNRCENDGSAGSGQESRSASTLASVLEGPGLDIETFEPSPGRTSLVARIEGADPKAPTLVLMGHTDVVPANEAGWSRDPYGGELVDGEVWGRGAVDMLNLTSSMAVATRKLADSGFRPRGTLVYLAVADEEAMGTHGAEWLVDHEPEAVLGDYVITESGGIPMPTSSGLKLPLNVGEKGTYWCKLRVSGTPGHASRPLRTDNALVTAAEVVRRIAEYRPEAQIGEVWRRYVQGMDFPPDLAAAFLDPERIDEACAELPRVGLARAAHACTHTTFAPTVIHGGTKTNVIPDLVELEVDIRTLPGQSGPEVRAMLDEALGDLAARVDVSAQSDDRSSQSPVDSALFDALQRAAGALHPGATVVPSLMAGATDARFFRRKGATAYGFGLFSGRLTMEDFASMYHGDDERVDVESLRLSTALWRSVAQDFLA